MCLTIRLEVSRPLVSAFASAFLRRPRRNSADLTGHRARVTPNCFPVKRKSQIKSKMIMQGVGASGAVGREAFIPSHSSKQNAFLKPLTLTRPPSSPSISSHRYRLLVSDNIAQIRKSTFEFPSVDRLGSFAGVFERDTQVSTASAGRLARLNLRRCVADLRRKGRG